MYELWLIVLSTAVVNNAVLAHLTGADATVRDSFTLRRARAIALSSGIATVIAGAIAWWIDHLAFAGDRFGGLRLLVFALTALSVALPVERLAAALWPSDFWRAEGRVPLVMANAMVLGGMLLATDGARSFGAALATLIGLAAGFVAVLLVMAALHERIAAADVPNAFRGGAISILTLGLLAMAVSGLVGMAGR